MFSIGDLSKRTGVKVPTIRYYEQMGLVTPAERSHGNQRRYSAAELERLAFIKHARDLGLSIEAIRELIDLSAHPDQPCADIDQIARRHLHEIRAKISSLRQLEGELSRIIEGCDHGNNVSDCYVLRALGDHRLCRDDH